MQNKFFLLTFLFFVLLANTLALPMQSQSGATPKGKEAVCDGALEIIPSGQMTFARKRYTPPVKKNMSKNSKRGRR